MICTIQLNNRKIEVTTERAESSYGQPVVLVDGQITDISAMYEADEPDDAAAMERYVEARPANAHWAATLALHVYDGGWTGPATLRALSKLHDELWDRMAPADVLTEWKRTKPHTDC